MEKARWYFDLISPYAYLHLHKLGPLRERLQIEPVPVLFAGLLKHWETKGPAEIPPKRLHTYQQCVWMATQTGIPFVMPPRHPFNPLSAQRLLVALDASFEQIERAYHFIFGEGRDAETEFLAFAQRLGITDPLPLVSSAEVKQRLQANTQEAIASGVFGVPSLVLRDRVFWGSDTVEWALKFLQEPDLFERPEYQRLTQCEVGVRRA